MMSTTVTSEDPISHEKPCSVSSSPLLQRRALIVDDLPHMWIALRAQLYKIGFQEENILHVHSGQEAIDAVKKSIEEGTPYDAIYMDYEMHKTGVIQGDKATVEIRKLQAGQKRQSVIITHSDNSDIIFGFPEGHGRCPGADAAINKLFDASHTEDAELPDLEVQDLAQHSKFLRSKFKGNDWTDYSNELRVPLPSELTYEELVQRKKQYFESSEHKHTQNQIFYVSKPGKDEIPQRDYPTKEKSARLETAHTKKPRSSSKGSKAKTEHRTRKRSMHKEMPEVANNYKQASWCTLFTTAAAVSATVATAVGVGYIMGLGQ